VLIKINNCQKTIVELGRHRFPLINAKMEQVPLKMDPKLIIVDDKIRNIFNALIK